MPIFVSDGSSSLTDAQLLAKTADLELEFNGTVEEVPVYTEAGPNIHFVRWPGFIYPIRQQRNRLFQF